MAIGPLTLGPKVPLVIDPISSSLLEKIFTPSLAIIFPSGLTPTLNRVRLPCKSDLNGSLSRLRVGIKPEGKIIAREGVKIFSEDGKEIGSITSGTFGPSVNGPIAMGYVKLNFSKPGTKIFLEVRGKKHEARVSELPFYKKNYVR